MAQSRDQLPDQRVDAGDPRALLPRRADTPVEGLSEYHWPERPHARGEWDSRWTVRFLGDPVPGVEGRWPEDRRRSPCEGHRRTAYQHCAGDRKSREYGA